MMKSNRCLQFVLKRLFRVLGNLYILYVLPHKLTKVNLFRSLYPAFEPYTQQDAQECFHCILNICNSVVLLLNEKLKVRNFYRCLVVQNINITLRNTICCIETLLFLKIDLLLRPEQTFFSWHFCATCTVVTRQLFVLRILSFRRSQIFFKVRLLIFLEIKLTFFSKKIARMCFVTLNFYTKITILLVCVLAQLTTRKINLFIFFSPIF